MIRYIYVECKENFFNNIIYDSNYFFLFLDFKPECAGKCQYSHYAHGKCLSYTMYIH